MEHSDRGRYVTDQVILWIQNDSDYIQRARDLASQHTLSVFSQCVTVKLRNARMHSAYWHVAQELAPNDYDRIDWAAVAESLREE